MKGISMKVNKTILVIDDDVDFQMMVGHVLNGSGYKVKSLLEGHCNKASRMARICDMVLLDIELPGDSGVDVGKQLKSDPSTENIPIIMISGHSEGQELCRESHANAFIQKPFSFSGLLLKIKELLPARD
jgi:CheY-like chemotaxis protein